MQALFRRSHPRFEVRRLVSYHYGGKRFLTLTLDLALGGMKIETCSLLPQAEHLDIQLVLDNRSIWLKGRTIYSDLLSDTTNVSGIQFLDVLEEDRVLLQRYLSRLHRLPVPQGIPQTEGEQKTIRRRERNKAYKR